MKINKSYLIAGLALLVIIIWFVISSGRHEDPVAPPKASTVEREIPSVVVEPRTAVLHQKTLSLYGRTEAAREVEIKAETAGLIVATPAREGSKINAGAIVCRQDVDARAAMLDQARANLQTAEADLNAATILAERGFQSSTRVTAIQAQVDGARAQVKSAQIELDNVNMRAPFSGIWERQIAEVGDYLAPGQACGLLVELSPLIVTAELTEQQVGLTAIGKSAKIDLATGQSVDGIVRLIKSRANPTTRTFRAEIAVPNDDFALKAGVTATIRLSAGEIMAQQIPSQILALSDEGLVGVRYVTSDDTVGFAHVQTVDEDEGGIWVTGLPEQTRIIVKGQDYVSEGSKVEVTMAGASPSEARQ